MSAQGDDSGIAPRTSRRRNRIIAVFGTVAALVAVWLTEAPQERAADWALEWYFGTGVQVEYGGAFGALRVESLKLFSSAKESGFPVVEIDDLVVDYALFPDNGRRIPAVTLGRLSVRLDATDPAHPNFAFIEPLLASEGEPPPESIVPRSVQIDEIDVAAAGTPPGAIAGQPFDSTGFSVAGVRAAIELNDGRVSRAKITGDTVLARAWVGDANKAREAVRGRVDIAYSADAHSSRMETIQVDLPDFIEINGAATIESNESSQRVQARFDAFKLFGNRLHSERMPVGFGAIDASGAVVLPDAASSVPITVQGLRIGPMEKPMYDGDLTLAVTREPDRDFEIAATLDEGQVVTVQFNPWSGSMVASVGGWTPEMLRAATPPVHRERLTALPDYEAFSLTVAANAPATADWLRGDATGLPFNFSVFGDASLSDSAKEAGFRIEAAGSGEWTDGTMKTARAQGDVVIAGERTEFDVRTSEEAAFLSDIRLVDVTIGRWLKLALGDVPVGSDSGKLNGALAYNGEVGSADITLSRGDERATLTAQITGSVGGDALQVNAAAESGGKAELTYTSSREALTAELDCTEFDLGRLARLVAFNADLTGTATGSARYVSGGDDAHGEAAVRLDGVRSEDWSLHPEAPIALAIAFDADAALQDVRGQAGKVTLGDETILALERWEWSRDPFLFEADVTAALDLERHGGALGIEGWAGQATAAFSIAHREDGWHAPGKVDWADPVIPGFEDLRAGPIGFQGDVIRQPGSTATTVRNGTVTWGEHTKVALPRVAVETSPFGVLGEVRIESDMTVLVALGLMQYIDAAMTGEGEVRLVDGNPQFDLAVDADIAAFQLPDGFATAGGAKLSGRVAYDGAYGGSGAFSAVEATSAGAVLTDIAGAYAFAGDRLLLNEVSGQLYGGAVAGDGKVELVTGTYNGEFKAGIARLDLDRFTKEFQPGEFRLTGIADGDVYARWSTVGLSGARFFLTSTEGFSLDRETVETLLTTSAIPDRWGMRWIRNRINKKMVGEEPQRPFDSARVELTLQQAEGESDRLLGPITLKSETLDMNIEWAVDVDAIYAAMESDLTAVENISTGAVQSGNQ